MSNEKLSKILPPYGFLSMKRYGSRYPYDYCICSFKGHFIRSAHFNYTPTQSMRNRRLNLKDRVMNGTRKEKEIWL